MENSTDGRIGDTLEMFVTTPAADLRRGPAEDPSQSSGDGHAERNHPGLQQASGPVAMPRLDRQAPAGRSNRSR